jgi:tetratricopeptide (TPR) repeat protein
VHVSIGLTLSALGKVPEAMGEYRRAIQLQPDLAMAHNNLGRLLEDRQQLAEAAAEYRQAAELDPDYALVHYNLGGARARFGQWQQAAADYARAFELELPEGPYYWLDRACVLLQLGDTAGYQNLCSRMREHYGQSREKDPVAALAHTCALGPDAFPDAGLVLKLAEQRLAVSPPSGHDAWSEHVLGLAYYRAGQYDQAAACLGQALQHEPDWEHKVLNWLVLALAEQRLGHDAAARQWLDMAEQWIKQKAPGAGQKRSAFAIPGWHWRDALMVQLFRREAEALLSADKKD